MNTNSNTNHDTILSRDINMLFKRAYLGEKRGKKIRKWRGLLACTLKIVAGVSSLIVATNFFSDLNRYLGIAISVAIFVDLITANYKKLISEVKAGYAYKFLYQNIGLEMNRKLSPINEQLKHTEKKSEEEKNLYADEIHKIEEEIHQKLSKGLAEIEKALADADIKALEGISLDNERATAYEK